MNLVRITGAYATLQGLRDIVDMILVRASVRQLDSGTGSVAAYATDRAITEIESRGATVEVIADNAALEQQLDRLYDQIPDDESGVG